MTTHRNHNESAASLAWVMRRLGLVDDVPGLVSSAWDEVRQRMLSFAGGGQSIVQMQSWISDPWLARNARPTFLRTLAPVWDPPEQLAEWPTLGVSGAMASYARAARRTNHGAFVNLLAASGVASADDTAHDAVAGFSAMQAAIRAHADPAMVQVEHVRAWLGTAVGHLLMAIMLTPPDEPDTLMHASLVRLEMPYRIGLPTNMFDDILDRYLELLYNSRMLPDGKVATSTVRIGQGEEWRGHWAWLSSDIEPAAMLESIRLAARLMRCAPLLDGLYAAIEHGDEDYFKPMAVAVIRRLLLTLKTMAWLEAAVSRPWTHVRPQDLACFAFSATKPDWPRRVIAVSHRSADVKPTLIDMQLWQAGRCAIDANYVPSWETNTGMLWSLFAATPAIARVWSPRYEASVWCRREAELSDYLADACDFMAERWVIDVEHGDLRELDRVTNAWDDGDEEVFAAPGGIFREFPPLSMVWTPTPMPEWEVKMLRASAALRLMNVLVADPATTNSLARYLESGADVTIPAPTNNPDGWRAYADILREARLGDAADEPAVQLPNDYADEQRALDAALSQRIPNLSAGTPALRDVLVALEWLRVEWPALLEYRGVDLVAINCRDFSRADWQNDERLSLLRGLAVVRLYGPLWFLQLAGQDVETWPFVGERPIFTEHVSSQYAWMSEIFPERRAAQERYATESGMILSGELARRCRQAAVDADAS